VEPLNSISQTPQPDEHSGPLAHTPAQPPLWAQRLLLGIEVGVALWTGILVLLLPWTRLWTENPLLAPWPSFKLFLNHTFIRGMISGIGLLDIWIGASDALHYRDLR
jgi:hypothetical protein